MSMSYTILDGRDKDDLNANIQSAKSELTQDIQAASSALHSAINSTKTELQGNIDALETKHDSDKSNLQSQIDDRATKAELEAHNVSSTAHNDIREIIENIDTGKIDDTIKVADGIAVCEEHLGGAPLVGTKVYGETKQNLWVNPSGTNNGITVTANANGSLTLSGMPNVASSSPTISSGRIYTLKPNTTYIAFSDKAIADEYTSSHGACLYVSQYKSDDSYITDKIFALAGNLSNIFVTDSELGYATCRLTVRPNTTVSGTHRVMLREATPEEIEQNKVLNTTWCPPGLNSIDSLKLITTSKNILANTLEDTTYNTMSVKINDDGSITLDGKNKTSVTALNFDFSSAIPPVGTVVSQFKENYSGAIVNYGFYTSDGSYHDVLSNTTGNNYTITEDDVSMRCYVRVTGSAEFDNVTIRPCLTIGETCDTFYPMDKSEVSIDLNDNALRSLPDGTRDELQIDEGGNCTLVKRIHEQTVTGSQLSTNYPNSTGAFTVASEVLDYPQVGNAYWDTYGLARGDVLLPEDIAFDKSTPGFSGTNSAYPSHLYVTPPSSSYDGSRQWLNDNNLTFMYKIATPQTISLGKISLPKLPSQTLFVWFDSSITVNDFNIRYWLPSGELVANLYDRDSYTLLDMYPVDSVYLTMASSNPSTLFGGQWEEVSDVVNSESGVYAWRRIE